MNPTFTFQAELEQWEAAKSAWIYVAVPLDEADMIHDIVPERNGFGSIRVEVQLDEQVWRTSIFPMKDGRFFLPVKAAIRKKAGVDLGDEIEIDLEIPIDA